METIGYYMISSQPTASCQLSQAKLIPSATLAVNSHNHDFFQLCQVDQCQTSHGNTSHLFNEATVLLSIFKFVCYLILYLFHPIIHIWYYYLITVLFHHRTLCRVSTFYLKLRCEHIIYYINNYINSTLVICSRYIYYNTNFLSKVETHLFQLRHLF